MTDKKKSKGRRSIAKERVKKDEYSSTLNQDAPVAEEDPMQKTTFFGLVAVDELEYFKQAESTLNLNVFESPEERIIFINSVLEEAKGKELKLVTNQICSKLMERIILMGDSIQTKTIFRSFLGHFLELSNHKYSSHVIETILVRCASIIEKELTESDDQEEKAENVAAVSMESMFLDMIKEFEPFFIQMIENQYASHVLRLLILILSGKELPSSTLSNSTLRSKRSKIARKMIEIKDNEDFNRSYQVLPSFKPQIGNICKSITKCKNRTEMRELSINKVASPVIQLLVQVEGIVDKERSIWHSIFLNEKEREEPSEGAYVEYLLSDSVGSHFLEAVIRNDGVRLKYIERLYTLYMKDRVLKLANRSTSGVFIIQALLLKLKPVEVEFILDELIPKLADLISIEENQNLELAQSVIQSSIKRHNYRKDDLVDQFMKKFSPGFSMNDISNFDSTDFIQNTLKLDSSTLGNTKDDWPTAEERRRSLFVEKLMEYDFSFVLITWINFISLNRERFLQMCYHGVFSRVIEHSLMINKNLENENKGVLTLRKKLLNIFLGNLDKMSCNSYASHIVDKLWNFTIFLNMYKDRVANELLANSSMVKESTYGRLVWKNWKMDLFIRKKYEWKSLVKQAEVEYLENMAAKDENISTYKKPIELKLESMFKSEDESKKRLQAVLEASNKKQKVRSRQRF